MTINNYASDIKPLSIRVRDDVLAGHPVISANRPLTCRWPGERPPLGIIVFCHGLGSSGAEYAALSTHWARHGYLVVHPTFADSIDVVARTEPALGLNSEADLRDWTASPAGRTHMHGILHSPASWLRRLEVVNAVTSAMADIVAQTCGATTGSLPCAIAGHSFGAYTAQLLAGAEIDLSDGRVGRFRDRRFAAAIILSGQGRDQQGLREGSWTSMDGPVLTVTGTLDQGAKGGDWRWKSEPFELAPAGSKYLMVIDDGDHFLGGFSETTRQRQVSVQRAAVEQTTLAFLDAHLRGQRTAFGWLRSISDTIAGCSVRFEHK